ncbi:DeoR/GlpR family DNA-binding transcription regulator [Streptococcus sp. DD12]|uniref:DeoR/GlpR family DNA-binding transcription regulator n=1 Tax=Streptococcus sp. DD12 TaxID=1777880 RepID=UPI000792CAAB|nr:DeoR/GlpR family DNA-binding transcription regulator [Streptococcus sp. DD12]KXT75689.1 Transcriptional repressor [Streptococcus sp. DD12]
MYQEQRLSELLDLLSQRGQLSAKEMVAHFQVSPDTIRRDFALLAQRGLAQRTHGGLIPCEQEQSILSFEERNRQLTKAKRQMAQKAYELIRPDQLLFLDVSTTILPLAQILDKPCTVYSHSLDNALVLSGKPDIDFHLIGGKFYTKNRFYYSPQDSDLLKNMTTSIAFFGAASLNKGQVCYEDLEDVAVKQAILAQAQTKVLLAETNKWDKTSKYILDDLSAFDYWICEQKPAQDILDQLPQELRLIY